MEVFIHVKNVLQTTMLLTVMAVLLLTIIVPQKTEAADSLNIMADAAILVDADSGKILYAKRIFLFQERRQSSR